MRWRRAFLAGATVFATAAGLLLAPVPTPSQAGVYTVVGPRVSGVRVVAALGDSVPGGSACACAPFPNRVAVALSRSFGHSVATYDDARPGFTTADILHQLFRNPTVISHVRVAQTVEIEIGANDVEYSRSCGVNLACYQRRLPTVTARLIAIVSRIQALTAGHRPAIVLLGYWNVWLDGTYAAARGAAYVTTSTHLTRQENVIIQSIARRSHSAYVDLWYAFRGAGSADDTRLLAPDGDHPNAQGHEVIARSVLGVMRRYLAS